MDFIVVLKYALRLMVLLGCLSAAHLYAERAAEPPLTLDEHLQVAYEFYLPTHRSPREDIKALAVLESLIATPKGKALHDFVKNRTLAHAFALIKASDSPESLALGYICLAEAYYAKGQTPKALMAGILSLAYSYAENRAEQVKFYLTGHWESDLSLSGTREEVIDRLVDHMHGTLKPETFRHYFELTSVLGLLPEYPFSKESLKKKKGKPLHLIVGFDDNYVYHGSVTLLSAMLSAEPCTRYVFHIPEDPDSSSPITEIHQKQLKALADHFPQGKYEVVLEKYTVDLLPPELAEKTFKKWPRGILFKLYIPEFYTKYDKVMWLDSDLIVRSDLTPFYAQPMGNNWIVAVRDLDALDHLPRLGLEMEDAYVSAGVMVFDNTALKPNMFRINETVMAKADKDGFLIYPEQDVFAVAFRNHIKEVSFQRLPGKKYYFKTSHWNWFYHTKHPSVYWDAVHHHFAHIIHMASKGRKPWNRKKSPLYWSFYPKRNDGVQNLYWALRDMGPWPSQK